MEQTKIDIHQMVTDKIISLLEAGKIPWKTPCTSGGHPANLLTRKPFRGINALLLNSLGYEQNYFLTFEQAKAIGASVIKDEKSHLTVFWKRADPANPDQSLSLRYNKVFNVAQCKGIPKGYVLPFENDNDPIEVCARIVSQMANKPTIEHWENRSFYNAEYDIINVPEIEYFIEAEAYYATLFHELVHSTGHETRLNRKELAEMSKFGTDPYTQETLIAEIGGGLLQSYAGINHNEIGDKETYIQGWIAKLRHDSRCITFAGASAQKAVDYILKALENAREDLQYSTQPKTA